MIRITERIIQEHDFWLLTVAVLVCVTGSCLSVLFSGTVSIMHYVGMQAYMIPGHIVWDHGLKTVSVVLGVGLGAAAYHRIAYPVTRYCWLGGAVLMSLSIYALHLIDMSAISVQLSPLVEVSPQVISGQVLGALVFGVTLIILASGFVSLGVETTLEGETLQKLAHIASHDHLTGIPDRLWLSRFLDGFSERVTMEGGGNIAITAIDLHHFKEVNVLRGHAAADHVLKGVARNLANACHENAHIARTGGDEFTAIKIDFASEKEVVRFAERLRDTLREPIDGEGYSIHLGATLQPGR